MNTLTSFFAGIMAFISSIFGQHAQVPVQPVVNQPVEQITQIIPVQGTNVSVATTAATITSLAVASSPETFSVFSKTLYDTDVSFKYPKGWNIVKTSNDSVAIYDGFGEKSKIITRIDFFDSDKRRNNHVLTADMRFLLSKEDSLFSDLYKGSNSKVGRSEVYKNNSNNCFQIYEIQHTTPEDKRRFVIFSDYDDTCTVNTEQIRKILETVSFKQSDVSPENLKSSNPLLYFEEKLNGKGQTFYVNKDNSKVYFYKNYEPLERPLWKYPDYRQAEVGYFDIKTEKEYETSLIWDSSLNDVKDIKNKVYPYLTRDSFEKYNEIAVTDLDKERSYVAYRIKNENESLIAKCSSFGFEDNIHYDVFSDIEYLGGSRLRVGVYKNSGQKSQHCNEDTIAKYEKIRDDYVDLTKF